jgi:hypothetical protein
MPTRVHKDSNEDNKPWMCLMARDPPLPRHSVLVAVRVRKKIGLKSD